MTAGNPTPTTGAAEATADPARRSNLVLTSSGPDSDAVDRITARHAQLAGSAAALTAQLLEATTDGDRERIRQANKALLDWAQGSLDSLLGAEQSVVDPAIRQADAGLSDRLSTGRRLVTSTVLRLAGLSGAAETAGTAAELRVHLGQYLRSFDDLALPLLARSSGLPLSSLWSEIESLTATTTPRFPAEQPPAPAQRIANAASSRNRHSWNLTCGLSRTPSATPPSSAPSMPSDLAEA